MNKDTTFKEFVHEKGVDFDRLNYDSDEYRELSKQFKEAKLELLEKSASGDSCQEATEESDSKKP